MSPFKRFCHHLGANLRYYPQANKFDGVDVDDEQSTEDAQFPDEDEYGNTYQQTLDDDTTDTSSANLPAEVSKASFPIDPFLTSDWLFLEH